jgi:hypothetical protein
MIFFPPWHNTYFAAPSCYSFIFISASPAHSINLGLLLQYLFVLTIGGILYCVLKDKNGKKRFDSSPILLDVNATQTHDSCLEPIKNQTLKNARLGFRIFY